MAEQQLAIRASTNVESATYDADTQQLVVTFKNNGGGATYAYSGIDELTAGAFERAESPGGFLHTTIKPLASGVTRLS